MHACLHLAIVITVVSFENRCLVCIFEKYRVLSPRQNDMVDEYIRSCLFVCFVLFH